MKRTAGDTNAKLAWDAILTINTMLSKLNLFVKINQAEIILTIGVILVSLLSFATGYITAKQQEKQNIYFESSVSTPDGIE